MTANERMRRETIRGETIRRDARDRDARDRAVAAAVADIRAIERDHGVTRDALARMKRRLLALAARRDLFPDADFPPPPAAGPATGPEDAPETAHVYRIAEDADHRFALYVQSARGALDTPPHNHTTWAVIAGIRGSELNRFWDRTAEGGVRQSGARTVRRGSAVAFLPDELHSIHVAAGGTALNFHMYGLALDHLHTREYYRAEDRSWRRFPAQRGIIDARGG